MLFKEVFCIYCKNQKDSSVQAGSKMQEFVMPMQVAHDNNHYASRGLIAFGCRNLEFIRSIVNSYITLSSKL
jgi:hypothetical protein